MNKLLIGLFSLILTSCSIGKQGVFYDEMSKKPTLKIGDNLIVLTTDNSNKNSALSIYDIDYSIDTTSKQIELRGF